MNDLYALLTRADAMKPVTRGANLLKRQLPHVAAYEAALYPARIAALKALHLRTEAGARLRVLIIDLLARWHAEFPRFAADVKRSRYAWEAAVRFGTWNNRFADQVNAQLSRFFASLSPSERAVVGKAALEMFGAHSR